MPLDLPVIDLAPAVSAAASRRAAGLLRPLLRDAASLRALEEVGEPGPAGGHASDELRSTLEVMDRCGIERGLLHVCPGDQASRRALRSHPDRFLAACSVDPNRGMEAVRRIARLHQELGIRAVSAFPAGCCPQVPIDDKRFYPIYAKCVELDLPILVSVGVPAARVPFAAQHVARIDEVCWFFPELRFVMRDGGEPWTQLAVRLMRKWPNLYYSTAGLSPARYPPAIVEYANSDGADKLLFGGGFPAGPDPERVADALRRVPLRDQVWPAFLRGNAERVLRLRDPEPRPAGRG
jgi:predicted TIM-barrel fold metal-dependent hydrolase